MNDIERIQYELEKAVVEERERCAKLVEEFAKNYPTDVFPEAKNRAFRTPDSAAAAMARHVCKVLAADIRKEPEEDDE